MSNGFQLLLSTTTVPLCHLSRPCQVLGSIWSFKAGEKARKSLRRHPRMLA